MNGFFNPNSKFSLFMSRVFDMIILNLIFIVMCLPIVTIGPNITAMYYVTLKLAKGEDTYIWKPYWKSFRQNFKQGTIIGLIVLAIGLLLIGDIYFLKFLNFSPSVISTLRYVFIALMVVFLFFASYVFPLLAKFDNTIKRTMLNALLMSIRHIPYTLLLILVLAVPVLVFLLFPQIASYVLIFMIMLGFSTIIFVNSCIMVKVFANYLPEEEEDVITPDEEFSIPDEEPTALTDTADSNSADTL